MKDVINKSNSSLDYGNLSNVAGALKEDLGL